MIYAMVSCVVPSKMVFAQRNCGVSGTRDRPWHVIGVLFRHRTVPEHPVVPGALARQNRRPGGKGGKGGRQVGCWGSGHWRGSLRGSFCGSWSAVQQWERGKCEQVLAIWHRYCEEQNLQEQKQNHKKSALTRTYPMVKQEYNRLRIASKQKQLSSHLHSKSQSRFLYFFLLCSFVLEFEGRLTKHNQRWRTHSELCVPMHSLTLLVCTSGWMTNCIASGGLQQQSCQDSS